MKKRSILKIGAITLSLALILFGTAGAMTTGAWFSDNETSDGNIFIAGELDLTVGGNGSLPFEVSNIVPSDHGTGIVTLTNVGSIPGNLSMTWTKTIDDENDMLEPETAQYPRPDGSPGLTTGDYIGTNSGELDFFLQFAPFVDLNNDGAFNGVDIQLTYGGQFRVYPGFDSGSVKWSGLNSYAATWNKFIELDVDESVNIVIPWQFPNESGDNNYSQNMAMTDRLGFDIQLVLNQVQ